MTIAYMTPFGFIAIEDAELESMSPGGGTLLIEGVAAIFSAHFAVPTAVALVGISP